MVASFMGKKMEKPYVHFYFRIVVPVSKILLILTFDLANKIVNKFRLDLRLLTLVCTHIM